MCLGIMVWLPLGGLGCYASGSHFNRVNGFFIHVYICLSSGTRLPGAYYQGTTIFMGIFAMWICMYWVCFRYVVVYYMQGALLWDHISRRASCEMCQRGPFQPSIFGNGHKLWGWSMPWQMPQVYSEISVVPLPYRYRRYRRSAR